MIEILDLKVKILDIGLNQLKSTVTASANNYISGLLHDYQGAYIAFILIMSSVFVGLVLTGSKMTKKNLINTNMALRIIPYESLTQQDREDINDFFEK